MGKAKIRKKLKGYEKQLRKHMTKFEEAKSRDAVGSMNYMAREMSDYLKKMDKFKKRVLPKKKN